MLSKAQLQSLKEDLALRVPVLSLYLDVNPANPDNSGKAYVLRVKELLKSLEVPANIGKQVLDFLQGYIPSGRTLIVFAAEEWLEQYHLQVELPLVSGVEGQWGQANLAPIWFALDEYQRYAVVHLSQEHLQVFEVYLGEIEELSEASRTLDTQNWRYLGEDRTSTPGRSASPANNPVGVAARGGSGKDKFQRRVDEWSQRFYREVGSLLETLSAQREIERLILLGAPEEAHKQFPTSVTQKVVASLPGLTSSAPGAAEVLRAVEQTIEQLERKHEQELIHQVLEKGVNGLDAVLSLLQEGRLQYLLIPWSLSARVWRCPEGFVSPNQEAAQAYCPNQAAASVDLKTVLPDLALSFGTELEFVRGLAEEQLIGELGGLAGLPRW